VPSFANLIQFGSYEVSPKKYTSDELDALIAEADEPNKPFYVSRKSKRVEHVMQEFSHLAVYAMKTLHEGPEFNVDNL
jgi:hypothetical protein